MTDVLRTDRLILREMSWDDLEVIHAMMSNPAVTRYWPAPFDEEMSRGWVQGTLDRYARDGCGYWMAIHLQTGEVVGQAGILMIEVDGAREFGLGYIIDEPFWKQGYGSEAAAACMERAFADMGARRIVAPIAVGNAPSIALARKLGLRHETTTIFHEREHEIWVAQGA